MGDFGDFGAEISAFSTSKTLKSIKIGRDAFNYPQTKLIRPCKSVPAKQKSISGENLTFPFSQVVILVIFQLKFHLFSPPELKKSIIIGRDAFHFPQSKLIRPC